MKRRFHPSTTSRVLLSVCLILGAGSSAHAACAPPGSPAADAIICTGTDTDGVASDGGNDSVTVTTGALIMLDVDGIRNPKAFAVDAGDDRDTVFNAGAIVAKALAVLTPVLTPPAPVPGTNFFWGALIKVGPEAKGIDGGAGNDTITNTGSVSSTVSATTLPGIVPAAVEGIAKADISSTANAKSTAIDGGDDNDSITNTGSLTVDATASAIGVSVSLAPIKENGKDGKSKLNGNVKANASATGLAGGAGDDTVTNLAAFDVTASSFALAAGGSGVEAKGSAAASAKSTSESNATAIDLGGDNDTLANHAKVTATAGSTATALDVAVGDKTDPAAKGKVKAAADGSATAKSTAIGIAADGLETSFELDPELLTDDTSTTVSLSVTPGALASGDDTVTNTAEIGTSATATTLAAGVGVAINGQASAKVTSNAEGVSAAIDLGGGDDTLTNTGKLTSTAGSIATALDIAVGDKTDPDATVKVKSAAAGGATANSLATGIAADGVSIDTEHKLELVTDDTSTTLSYSQTKAHGIGDDTVTNHAEIGTTATATTLAAGVGVTINGKGSADVKSNSEGVAAAIDLGGGDDTLTNTGKLTSTAIADASALNVAVGESGDSSRKNGSKSESAADGGATAKAVAVGISSDGATGDTQRGGKLTVEDSGPLFGYGLLLGYNQTENYASGDDAVTNDGDIEAHASATARAAGVGVTVKGAASANSTSTTESAASAIDLGRGNDTLTNTGKLTVTADSSSQALKVAVSTDGKAQSSDGLWNGGIKSEADATGIDAAGAQDSSTVAEVSIDDAGINARYETKKGDIALDPDNPEAGDTADGNDRIINHGDIDTHATATSNALNVAVTSEGTASAVSHVEAKAGSTGIRAGSGDDEIQNLGPGQMTVIAESHANAGKVAVSGKGAAVTADALWDGGTRSEANAVGIDGDGGATDTKLITVGIGGADPVKIVYETKTTSASGADTIVNEHAIDVTAQATAPSLSVALEAKKGLAAVVSNVGSEAKSTAIRGGDGDDNITNRGKLTSTATAFAAAANFALAKEGVAAASDSVWDGGTKADATAVGIDADGGDLEKIINTTLTLNRSGATIVHTNTIEAAHGNDTVVNDGEIAANATATAASVDVAITTKGLSAALSQSTAKAAADAIRGGDGNDNITNHGKLSSTATATAAAASVAVTVEKGVAIAGNAVWDGGVTAEATAIGIDADGGERKSVSTTTIRTGGGGGIDRDSLVEDARGNDIITNSGQIDAIADARAPEVSVAVAVKGVAGAISTSTAKSRAAAIDAGGGDDQVDNTGKLNAEATSFAVAVNGSGTNKGVAIAANDSWDGGVNADASARGIDGGAGFDHIGNDGEIIAHSSATAPSVSAAVAVTGVAGAVSTATATSTATAIDAGGGVEADVVSNLNKGTVGHAGKLTARAEALAATANVAVTNQGLAIAADAVWDGGTKAEATAKGIDVGLGTDTVTNEGEIEATSDATAASAAVSVAITGVAGATATSTATSNATAIDAGDGQDVDTVSNKGKLAATAKALAASASVSVTNSGVAIAADSVWDGGTKSEATARGIDVGNGADTVTNEGEIVATSDAKTGSAAVSVAVSGVAGASATSTAKSFATAIDTGDGYDTDEVNNKGKLTAKSDSLAVSASVSVTNAGLAIAADSVWDGGTTAEATAKGIDVGNGADTVSNEGEIEATSNADAGSAAVSVAVSGVAGASATSTATSKATAIDAGEGNDIDEVTNKGKLKAEADALAVSASVSVTTAGVAVAADAVWDGGTTAEATAKGIDTGDGADTVTNDGEIEAIADAKTGSAAVSVAVTGVAGAIATATGKSFATAIDTGAGNDADTVVNTGKLTATSDALAATVTVGVTTAGVSVAGDAAWDGGTKGETTAKGIDTGGGADTITNEGEIAATSDAKTASLAVSVAVTGAAGAVATSNATSRATAIDAGDGADKVFNIKTDAPGHTGKLTAQADALAAAASVTVTTAGVAVSADSVWDGGTKSEATARGIDTGLGADTIDNESDIEAMSDATTVSAAVGVAVTGVAGAIANATGKSFATAIDTGVGNDVDVVTNSGKLKVTSDTTAVSAAIGFTTAGVSVAGNASWDGGTTAEATAKGIDTGNGADTITNEGEIESTSDANAVSVAASIAVAGVAGAVSTATAKADSTAIDGGDGDDLIDNKSTGKLTAKADATGVAVNVAITGAGVAVAADSVWDGGTKSTATAKGIDGGKGQDAIANAAMIEATADSTTDSISVSLTGIGAGGAISTSTSTANATAIDGGDGADVLTNSGDLKAISHASATGVAVTATGVGVALASDAFWDGGTKANANATGMAGGAGDDVIRNTANLITADATSNTHSVAVAITGGGLAGAAAASTSTANATAIDGGAGHDDIINDRALVSNATSTAEGVSVAVAMTGGAGAGSFVDNVTKAEAIATGIAGGDGDDTIRNSTLSSITLKPGAEGRDTAVAVSLNGFSDADSQALAIARGTGIDGGNGNDALNNSGVITGTLTAESKARAISVSLAGMSGARASATAQAFATGIEGGNNDDGLMNQGDIGLTSKATARGQSIGVSVTGTTINNAKGTASAVTVGLAGGAGNDMVTNNGTITLLPTAETFGQTVGVSVAGASVNDASAVSDASATGMDGGQGNDTVTNNKAINATVSSTATARSTGVVVAGSTVNKSNSTAMATAIGIDGADNNDHIANTGDGTINMATTANAVANSVTVAVFGAANGEAQTTPAATAVGLEGAAGDDEIVNDGTIGVTATSKSTSTSSSTSVFGSTGSKAGTSMEATATGISGGDGDDLLLNRGMLTATASSMGTVNSSSWTLAGKAADESALKATARATGMAGGGDADQIRNEGDVSVILSSTLTATGGSRAIFGNATSNTQITAETDAIGLSGDAGTDVIENINNLNVDSTASLTSNKVTVSFAGSPSTSSVVVAHSRSTGIDAGSEADRIRNEGAITVTAASDSTATGGARTTFGGTDTDGVATADATALGIEGGTGTDVITNARLIDVTATTDATTTNSSDSGWLTGDGDTRSQAATTVGVVGVSGGDGDNVIMNDDEIKVGATGTGYTFSYASGAHLSFDGDGESLADSRATAKAIGISAGDGDNVIVNNKLMTVSSVATTVKTLTTTTNACSQEVIPEECHDEPDPDDPDNTIQVCVAEHTVTTCQEETVVLSANPTYAGANGNGLAGDGTATAKGTVDAEAYGIQVGDGDNRIVNNQEISVTASPEAKATVFADGDAFGDARGTATATARAKAFGIWAGDGNNEITNNGTLTVTAAPRVQARTEVTGGDICIWYLFGTWCGGGGSGIGTSTATFDAQAYGIRVGAGENLIVNNGDLKVIAAPAASDFTAGVFSANSATRRTPVTSTAVGILTGDNDNEIYNTENGVIDVEARDVPIGYSCDGGGCTHTISAVGIQTGAGDDLIVNDGAINTSIPSGAGVGIQSGAGDDSVELGDGSSVIGSIDLGTGNDSLTFSGSAKVTGLNNGPGSLNGGTDTDSLIFDGAGSYSGSILNFENATKQGNGTFALSSLPTMQQLKVSRGTLQSNSSYSFATGGSIETWIYGGGDLGRLLVNGGSVSLAGNLSVSKGHGAFIDGTQYNVVETTGGIVGGSSFDNVQLPAPSPLLHFSYTQLPNVAQVEANVASFTTVTTNPTGMAMAKYLDTILPAATGDLSGVLGQIQGLPVSEHDKVYASLSPDSFSASSQGASAGIQASTGSLQQRMQSVRLGDSSSVARSTSFADGKPVMLAFNGSEARLGRLLDDGNSGSRQGMYGLWVNAFGQIGDQESDSAHAGFDYNVSGLTLGFDHDLSDSMLAGVSLGYARTNLHLDRNLGDGDVNATVFSVYGSYFTDNGYVEGALSHGNNRYANVRNILISGSTRVASSYHDGSLLSGTLAGGYYFKVSNWTWEPFASLQYSSLDEDSFDETGAGSVSLHVDGRRTQSLVADIGLRFRQVLERSNGSLIPELNIAWNHNFDLDDRIVTASFAGSPNATFSVQGQDIERNGVRLGAGVSYVNNKRLTSSLRYGAELRDGYTAQTLAGEVRYEFK